MAQILSLGAAAPVALTFEWRNLHLRTTAKMSSGELKNGRNNLKAPEQIEIGTAFSITVRKTASAITKIILCENRSRNPFLEYGFKSSFA